MKSFVDWLCNNWWAGWIIGMFCGAAINEKLIEWARRYDKH